MTTPAAVEALVRALGMAGIAVENVASIGNAEQWLPDTETAEKVFAALSPADRLAIAGISGTVDEFVAQMFAALRRRLVGTPPNVDSIDAAIGYALNDCEAAILAALEGAP